MITMGNILSSIKSYDLECQVVSLNLLNRIFSDAWRNWSWAATAFFNFSCQKRHAQRVMEGMEGIGFF